LLRPSATVIFHDFTPEWPGVQQAIADLGLAGDAVDGMHLWRPSMAAEPAPAG
jgi:hypothetical protein